MSAHQLHRILEVQYKTAWFLAHRIREAMATGVLNPFGSDGGDVEVDETFIGHDQTVKPKGDKKGRGYWPPSAGNAVSTGPPVSPSARRGMTRVGADERLALSHSRVRNCRGEKEKFLYGGALARGSGGLLPGQIA